MLPLLTFVPSLLSAVGTGVTAAATTAATAAGTAGTLSLAAAVGAGYALGSAAGGEYRPRREQGAGLSREAVRRELEAAYAKGYEEAQRVVMDELKALEYERGRKVAQRQQKGGEEYAVGSFDRPYRPGCQSYSNSYEAL